MSMLRVSIITVCRNSETTIEKTLSSVFQQTYNNIEHIIIDGNSTDSTLELIRHYISLSNNIKLVSEPDDGIYDAMNKGIMLATGDIIGILNSDDFYHDINTIASVVDDFNAPGKIDILFGGVDFINITNLSSPIRVYDIKNIKPWMMRFGVMPPHPAMFLRRSVHDIDGLYKTNYKIAADFDFLLRVFFTEKYKIKKVNRRIVRMRIGGVSTSGFRSCLVSSKEMVKALKANGLFGNYCLVSFRFFYKLFQYIFPR